MEHVHGRDMEDKRACNRSLAGVQVMTGPPRIGIVLGSGGARGEITRDEYLRKRGDLLKP